MTFPAAKKWSALWRTVNRKTSAGEELFRKKIGFPEQLRYITFSNKWVDKCQVCVYDNEEMLT